MNRSHAHRPRPLRSAVLFAVELAWLLGLVYVGLVVVLSAGGSQ